MGRDYRAVYQRSDGKFRRFPGGSWSVNSWGRNYYGFVWRYLGLPHDTDVFEDYPSLKFEYTKNDFEACRRCFNSITDEEISDACKYASEQMRSTPSRPEDEEPKYFREEIFPHFLRKNAKGVVEGAVENQELEESHGKQP